MKSTALYLALFKQSCRRAREYVNRKIEEFHAADADWDDATPMWPYLLFGGLMMLGVSVPIVVFFIIN